MNELKWVILFGRVWHQNYLLQESVHQKIYVFHFRWEVKKGKVIIVT